ncbi:anti-phage-associated DUF1156 domain-containing protein [Fibrella sp. ES10-3-2-2]|nr:DNA methylase [Fibrella sp. ES10-3-2-2]
MTLSFIETQFPVSKLSKESYKERMANNGQTLTGLGKWWGRKPLILVRATILGLLMPASGDPQRDRDIFLKILSMDDDGLWQRYRGRITDDELLPLLSEEQRERCTTGSLEDWTDEDTGAVVTIDRRKTSLKLLDADELRELQTRYIASLPYDDAIRDCIRPEHLTNLLPESWIAINAHLGTNAQSLNELVAELGQRQFGHVPRVGDAFCGGGSIPFEAARIGCDAYGSDLNPVAALLTWAALNIIGGSDEVVAQVRAAQQTVYDAVDQQVTNWGIEHNERGWRADAYLYCVEARDPNSGYVVPLIPNLVIGEKSRTVAHLVPNHDRRTYDIVIEQGVDAAAMANAKAGGTVKSSRLVNPDTGQTTPISTLRGREGLRRWENHDLVPRPTDVFQERLYCIRYVETYYEVKVIQKGTAARWVELTDADIAELGSDFSLKLLAGTIRRKTRKHYVAPDSHDLAREQRVFDLLTERFASWQAAGYVPSKVIESGAETDRLYRERGWIYWHQLFNPRQLLVLGLFQEASDRLPDKTLRLGCFLGTNIANQYNSRLSRYRTEAGNEARTESVYYNQALNTLFNYGARPVTRLREPFFLSIDGVPLSGNRSIVTTDARALRSECEFWITDPPYADAIMYHELNDFFLAWYEKHIPALFPEWYADSKKALAIRGQDEDFRRGMVEAYRNLARHMPDNGAQVVMFTHQDATVWADLALILWASGLRVTAAWTIATETDSALKSGNYVQGTVCMILRKQTGHEETFVNDVYPEVEDEVIRQVEAMTQLDDREDPNFGDADYQLAAYAAALRVLTRYRQIYPIDVMKELTRPRTRKEKNPLTELIEKAVEIATNHLVPDGLDRDLWITLTPEEKFYLKGLEVETHGEYRNGVYQELARGLGVREYRHMLGAGAANQTRIRTATEFANKDLRDEGFGQSLLRQLLFAIRETHRDENARTGRQWLKDEVPDYWTNRQRMIRLVRYVARLGSAVDGTHWQADKQAAELLAGALENDHV